MCTSLLHIFNDDFGVVNVDDIAITIVIHVLPQCCTITRVNFTSRLRATLLLNILEFPQPKMSIEASLFGIASSNNGFSSLYVLNQSKVVSESSLFRQAMSTERRFSFVHLTFYLRYRCSQYSLVLYAVGSSGTTLSDVEATILQICLKEEENYRPKDLSELCAFCYLFKELCTVF